MADIDLVQLLLESWLASCAFPLRLNHRFSLKVQKVRLGLFFELIRLARLPVGSWIFYPTSLAFLCLCVLSV